MAKSKGCLTVIIIGGLFFLLVIIGGNLYQASQSTSTKTRTKRPIEVRICAKSGVNVRNGPGLNYQVLHKLKRGQVLYVFEEKNGWIRYSGTPKDCGSPLWVKKSLTISELQYYKNWVNTLIQSGIVTKVNPEFNEAFVNPYPWSVASYEQKKSIGYVLAHYCGSAKGTNLYWVDIKDHYTGKRLAKYSEAWGFKVYQ